MTRLGELAWPDVGGRPLLLVPVGSTEQHGPHLPLDTDTRIAVAVADAVAADGPGRVVAPALAITASGEHAGFPGTLSIGTDGLEVVLRELVRSADAFAGVVLVNAHGGNGAALARAEATAREEGRRVLVVACSVPGADAHAGRTETSLLLHLAPDVVRVERAERGEARPWREIAERVRTDGVAAVAANGVLGDPSGASAVEGAEIFAGIVERARAAVSGWPDG